VHGAKDESMTTAMNKQMLYIMPAITIFIGFSLPGGLTFYWFLTTLLTAFQQLYIFKKHNPQSQQVPLDAKPVEIKEVKEIENHEDK